jgi:hypothetical protein
MSNSDQAKLSASRRSFIKTLGVLGAGFAFSGAVPAARAAAWRFSRAPYMGDFAAPKLEARPLGR